jgi:hypothetical protein
VLGFAGELNCWLVIIDVPRGATIGSIFLVSWRASAFSWILSSKLHILGANTSCGDAFGRTAERISRHIFDRLITVDTLIKDHSVFPLFSRLVSKERAAAWRAELPHDRRRGLLYRRYLRSPLAPPVDPNWRCCSECQSRDIRLYGIAHWHVAHQLPFINHCLEHGLALQFRCTDCHGPLGGTRLDKLPGETCANCGSLAADLFAIPTSQGYKGTAILCAQLLAGEGPDISPVPRNRLFRDQLAKVDSANSTAEFARQFLSHWHCETYSQLSEQLTCEVSQVTIARTLEGAEHAASAGLQLAMVEFASSFTNGQTPAGAADEAIDDLFLRQDSGIVDALAYRDLLRSAAANGFPLIAARSIASGISYRDVELQGTASVKFCAQFIDALPPWIRSQLTEVKELRMRQSSESIRDLHRERIRLLLERRNVNRTGLSAFCGESYIWALRYDRAWLDAACPCKPGNRRTLSRCAGNEVLIWPPHLQGSAPQEPIEAARAFHRGRICFILESLSANRTCLNAMCSGSYGWVLRNDREWLDAVCPCQPGGRKSKKLRSTPGNGL